MELWIRGYKGERLTQQAFDALKAKGFLTATVIERRLRSVSVEGLNDRPESLGGTLTWHVALPLSSKEAATMSPYDKQTRAERVIESYLNSQMVNCAEAYPSTTHFTLDGEETPRAVGGPSDLGSQVDLGREARLFLDDMQTYVGSADPKVMLEQAALKADPQAAALLRFLAETWAAPITPKELPNALVKLAEAKPGHRESMAKQMCGCTGGISPAEVAQALKQAQASHPLVDSLALANAGDVLVRTLDLRQLPY